MSLTSGLSLSRFSWACWTFKKKSCIVMKNRNIRLIHDIIRMTRLWFPHKNDVQFVFLPLPPVVCRRFHVLFMLLLSVCLQWCSMRFVSCKRQELLTLRDYLGSPPVIDLFFIFFCLRPLLCAQCLWIVQSWLPLRFCSTVYLFKYNLKVVLVYSADLLFLQPEKAFLFS